MNIYKHETLLEAFDIYVREQDELLPDEETLASITFSEEFEERMRRMIRRYRYGYYALFGSAGRRVASVAVALLVAAAVTTASVEALREPVVRFFTEVYEKFTQIFFVDETPDTPEVEMEKRAPAYLPEGYVLESEEAFPFVYRVVYTNTKTGDVIRYNQRWRGNLGLIADTEGVKHSDITIGNYPGVTYENKGFAYIVFSDAQYTYTVSGISYDDLLKIAESIL